MALRFIAKNCNTLLQQTGLRLAPGAAWSRTLTHYPINDAIYGLDEEQQKLREVAFNFFQKELAPYAKEIDKADNFK